MSVRAPRVAIVTRTKNRSLLLARCLRNVRAQTFDDHVHVIVNDGGDAAAVEACIDASGVDRTRLLIVHNTVSKGVGGAANTGMLASTSDLLVLLDDDDTWEPDYLQAMVQALDARRSTTVGGIACRTRIVRERVDGEQVTRVGETLFNPDLHEVLLFQVALKNRFNPNAFLFERRCLAACGLFREDLPVLEDWDFNLRFLQHFDIDVLPRVLANWHWRSGAGQTQTMTTGANDHKLFTNYLRNAWLRADLAAGKPGIGHLVAMATAFSEANHTLVARTRALDIANRWLAKLRPWP